jgi:tetratricopeptide (TPR) repeat protein
MKPSSGRASGVANGAASDAAPSCAAPAAAPEARRAALRFTTAATRVIAAAAIGLLGTSLAISTARAQVSPASADDTPQVDEAIAQKDWKAALAELDARLKTNPRDVQAKFKRATVLARLNRDDEAIAAFTELTQAYPELPEPYNNLAALYAKQGRYEDARAALETATKANPSYALAYDNLGDLYLRLAGESYKRAQSLGSKSPVTRQRISAIQNIITPPAKTRAGAAASAAAAASAGAASAPVSSVPPPDTYSPFGGPTGPLPTAPYNAPNPRP